MAAAISSTERLSEMSNCPTSGASPPLCSAAEATACPPTAVDTPAETREYRLARGRDANADTAFITMVIELEQAKLEARAQAAKIIVSKGAEILSYEACRARIEAGQRGEG